MSMLLSLPSLRIVLRLRPYIPLEVETLIFSSLRIAIIESVSLVAQHQSRESSESRVPTHICYSCGSLCTYDPTNSQHVGVQTMLATDHIVSIEALFKEAFGIDTQVNVSMLF
jgi:hypothetical protein